MEGSGGCSVTDLIRHTGHYSIIWSDYVTITGDACAAQLLAAFEKMTLLRLELSDFDPWLYVSINDLVESLCGTFKRNKVIESLKILRIKGFIESKPSSDPRDQTLLYKFNTETIQAAIDKFCTTGSAV